METWGGGSGARGQRAAAWRSVRPCCSPESLQPLMDTSSPPEPNTPHNICSQTAALTPNAAPRRPIPPAGGGPDGRVPDKSGGATGACRYGPQAGRVPLSADRPLVASNVPSCQKTNCSTGCRCYEFTLRSIPSKAGGEGKTLASTLRHERGKKMKKKKEEKVRRAANRREQKRKK